MPVPAGPPGTTNPPWSPDLVKVADRIPGRTLVRQVPAGSNVEVMTFDATTKPPAATVLRLIADAVAWVLLPIGPVLDPTLFAAATACAAVYTAAAVETGFPERESANEKDAQALGAALFKQATSMRTDLAARNDVLVGSNPAIFEVVPVWSFPPGLPDDYGFVPTIF